MELQLGPPGTWNVPLSVPVIDSPLLATLRLPDEVSVAPRPIASFNEKLGKLSVWPETEPETVLVGALGAWAVSCTWTAAPV